MHQNGKNTKLTSFEKKISSVKVLPNWRANLCLVVQTCALGWGGLSHLKNLTTSIKKEQPFLPHFYPKMHENESWKMRKRSIRTVLPQKVIIPDAFSHFVKGVSWSYGLLSDFERVRSIHQHGTLIEERVPMFSWKFVHPRGRVDLVSRILENL